MKNLILVSIVAAVLFCSYGSVHADEVTFGGKLGLAISNVTNTPESWEEAKSSRIGFTAGAFLNYAFNDNFSLQPELLYAMRGFKAELADGSIPVDLTIMLNYVEIPLLAKYTFSGNERLKPWIFAGPCVSYCLSSTLQFNIANIISSDIDISSMTHVSDFSFIAGAGLGIVMGHGMLTLDAAFQRGFTNVLLTGDFMINGSTQTIDEDDAKNYGFNITAGYSF